MDKYRVSEDQKFYYPYDKTLNMVKSMKNQENKYDFAKKALRSTRQYKSIDYGRSRNTKRSSEFFEQFSNIQDRFNTKNLNDFLKIYKSQEPNKRYKKKEFKYNYDQFIDSIGISNPKGDLKLDTVKNTIGAPDPKSSFFRVKDEHFVRKNSDKFFMDERLRKRNKKILQQNKLMNIINRENNFLKQKENYFQKSQQFLEKRRKNNKTSGIFFYLN